MMIIPKAIVNIYLRKDGRYEGRYLKQEKNKTGTKTKYGYVYGTTYEEAYIKLLREKELYKQELSMKDSRFLTMGKLIEEWLVYISHIVKPGTLSTYQNYANKYLIPKIGSIYVGEFDKYTIEGILKSFQKESKNGKEPAENTLYLLEEIIHLVFKYGCENNRISAVEFGRTKKHKSSKKNIILLSKQEKEQLLEVIYKKEIELQVPVLLSLYTGISLSELCGLKWKDIDLEHGRIKIVRGVKRLPMKKECKKNSTSLVEYDLKEEECREFSLPDIVKKILYKAGKKLVDIDRKEEWYIATLNEKQPEGRTLQYRLNHIGCEAGIGKINFRTLRDTFAIDCLRVGGDIYSVAYVLGIGINAACERYGKWIIKDDGFLKRIG